MNKSIIISLMLIVLLVVPRIALAQRDSDAMVQKERGENVRDRVQKRRETRQENRQERRDERASRHAERLNRRFGFYSERLNNLIRKIESRLNEMATNGKDVDAALAKLDEAKALLAESKSLGDLAIAAFEAIKPTDYESQRDKALAARDLAMQAKEKFKEAVTAMKQAVRLAKQVN